MGKLLQYVPTTMPMAIKVILIVLGAVSALGGFIFLLGFFNGFRQRATLRDMVRRGTATLLCIALAVSLLATGISAKVTPKAMPEALDTADDTVNADTEEETGDIPTSMEEFDAKAFYVDFDEEDLQLWLAILLGPGFDLDGDIRANYSIDQFPSQRDARNEAVRVAMRKYLDPNSEGFQDPVWLPFDELLEAVYNGQYKSTEPDALSINWNKADNDEKDAFMDRYVRHKTYLQILTSPAYCDMWLQFIAEYDNEFNHIISERNSTWLPQFIKQMDENYARTKEPIGVSAWFEMRFSKNEPIMLIMDYVLNAARLCNLLDCFDWTVPQVQELKSTINWHLPMQASANLTRTEKCDQQESLAAAILTHNYKSGNVAMRGGINAFDGRAEIYRPEQKPQTIDTPDVKDDPTPTSNPKPDKDPTPTGDNNPKPVVDDNPTPQPDTTPDDDPTPEPDDNPDPLPYVTLTVKYVYENGKTAHAPYTGQYDKGQWYEVNSPTVYGYEPDRKVVSGKMPGRNHTEKVVYHLIRDVKDKHNLLIDYVYEDGTTAAPSYSKMLAEGKDYNVASPVIEGYTADRPVVSGTMKTEDIKEQVVYTKTPDDPEPKPDPDPEPVNDVYTLTVRYLYRADNSEARPSATEEHPANEEYNVTSPVIDGYTADRKVVTGTMPASNWTETVYYDENTKPDPDPTKYTLTILYLYEDGSTAATAYTGSYQANEEYNVSSPTITGYTADRKVVTGNMPASNWTEKVYYTKDKVQHSLKIYYKYQKTGEMAAATYSKKLYQGESYNVDSPVIAGYTADRLNVSGTMEDADVSIVVWYKNDGGGDGDGEKNPDDSNGNQNPDHPGGDNAPGDGTGEAQPTKPPVEDTPEQQPDSEGNLPDTANQKPGEENNAGSDNRQEVSTEPIKADDDDNAESSGTGGKDHPVVDPNGGNTDNGEPPAKEEIPVAEDTKITDTTTEPDGSTSSTTTGTYNDPDDPSDDNVIEGEISEPEMED